MKKSLLRWGFVCLFVFAASAAVRGADWGNGRLPERPDTLRILGIGNSFTDDGMMYLPDLLREAGIENVVLGRLYFPGCSLEQHCRFYAEEAPNYIYYKSIRNVWETVSDRFALAEALEDERWDVVVLQQASHFSGLYGTYAPWLDRLIGIVLSHNSNPELCLAWQMTWAYAQDSDHGGFANYGGDQQRMYEAIVGVVKRLQKDFGIEVLIPTGTAVQNMRVFMNSQRDMTRDGYHLDLGAGRYTAACTWFEALIAPTLQVKVWGNSFRIPEKGPETTPVNNCNVRYCWIAAKKAVINPFECSEAVVLPYSSEYLDAKRIGAN